MNLFQKPLASWSAVAVVGVVVVALGCRFSFAEGKHPDRGSVQFGAQQKPDIKTAPALAGFRTVFADLAEKVIPTVVSIEIAKFDTLKYVNNPYYRFFDDPFGDEGSPFDFFNGPQMPQQRQMPQQKPPKPQIRKQTGMGSGVIVSKNGYILTNNHVIMAADVISVKTSDGRTYEAEIVGSDTLTDLAVIKIKDKEKVNDLPVAYLGDSDKLRPGDWAMAIGNPFALSSTVTVGIVSALGRSQMNTGKNQASFQNYIQTDAAINPGNSGGALVNIDGELIGINTMIITPSGAFAGIGLAVPISMARTVMEDLIYEGKVRRGMIGVNIQDLDDATKLALGVDVGTQGVLVTDAFKGQPADKAGIKARDVILSVNNKVVKNVNELRNLVASIHPGKKVPIVVFRSGKQLNLSIEIALRDEKAMMQMGKKEVQNTEEGKPQESDFSKFGVKVANLLDPIRSQYNIDEKIQGVVITLVTEPSQAADLGLQPGDVISEMTVNGQQTLVLASVDEFKKAVKPLKEDDAIMMMIYRNGMGFFKAFKLQK